MGPLKKRKIEEETVDNSDGDESSSEVSMENSTEIQTDFEGRNLEEFDFHGIKLLLQQTFLKAHVDISQITDMLINQQGIGSVLKQVSVEDVDDDTEHMDDDSQDVFGVTTILNLSAHRETPCVQQIFGFLSEQVKKHGNIETQSKFDEIIKDNRKIGLLINERFLNIPPPVAAPMLGSLQEELKKMKKKNKDYDFDHFVMICKTYTPKKGKGEASYSNDEECLVASQADYCFEYNVAKESDLAVTGKWGSEEEEVIPFRKVLLFSANKLDKIISDIKAFVQT